MVKRQDMGVSEMGGSGREVWDGKASGEGGVKCGVGEEGE